MASSIRQTPIFKDQSGSGSSLAQAYAAPVLAGDTLIVFASCPTGSTASVSDSVNGAWTSATTLHISDGGVNEEVFAFVLPNSLAGTPTVTVTFSPANTFISMAIADAGGVRSVSLDQIVGNQQSSPGTGTDAVTSGMTGPLSQSNALVIGFSFDVSLATTPAVGTGYSNQGTGWGFGVGSDSARMESKNVSTTAAVAATFTTATGTDHHVTFCIVLLDQGPTINTQPVTQTVREGSAATFNVSATTTGGTLHYQWHKNGSNVGTDSSSYTTPALTIADDPSYVYCTVTDDNGSTDTLQVYARVLESPAALFPKA